MVSKRVLMNRAYRLQNDGYSFREIATILNKPKSTVYRWVLTKQMEIENEEYEENHKNSNDSVINGTEWDVFGVETEKNSAESSINGTLRDENDQVNTIVPSNSWEVEIENLLRTAKNQEIIKKIKILHDHFMEIAHSNEELTRKNEIINKRLHFLVESHNKTNHDNEKNRIENDILQEKVVVISKILGIDPQTSLDEIRFESIRIRLLNMLDEYLDLEGQICSLNTLHNIKDQASLLKSEFDKLENTNFRKSLFTNLMTTLQKFQKDIKDSLEAMEHKDTDQLEMIFDSRFVSDMEDWMDRQI